jgi:CRISPR type III-A-associated RAMP protein Csm4
MNTLAVYLWPRGALASELGSDTLFGAVCWAIHILGLTDVGALLAGFDEQPRFAFSSAFPVYRVAKNGGAVEQVRFYPRPQLPDLSPDQVNALAKEEQSRELHRSFEAAKTRVVETAKRLKEKTCLSEALFVQVIRGETNTAALFRCFKPDGGYRSQDIEEIGNALMTCEERQRLQQGSFRTGFARQQVVQHNQIDRVAGATAEGLLFFEAETFFGVGGGLWCVLCAAPDDVERFIRPALRYLADTGLGANRTSGKGQFDIQIGEPLTLPRADEPDAFVTLSRYLPRQGEWSPDGEPLSYQLLNLWPKREHKFVYPTPGQRTLPVRKRRVRMFAPGSIFPLTATQPLYGRLAQVVPARDGGHTVWQSGLAVPVLARIGGGE